jgi:hypothetical protein
MPKRKWPDHIGVGREITVTGTKVTVVDVKPGKPFFYTEDLNKPHVEIHGTLHLRIKYPGGHEEWTPPCDGKKFCDWCDAQDKAKEATT